MGSGDHPFERCGAERRCRKDMLAHPTRGYPSRYNPPVPKFDDLFHVFRWLLSIIAGVYATIITVQSLWGWYVWLAGPDKYTSMLRRYVIVHGLRLRFRAFWGDVAVCIGLSVIFLLLWRAHVIMNAMGR